MVVVSPEGSPGTVPPITVRSVLRPWWVLGETEAQGG